MGSPDLALSSVTVLQPVLGAAVKQEHWVRTDGALRWELDQTR